MLQPVNRSRSARAGALRRPRQSTREFPLDPSTRILIVDSDRVVGIALAFMLGARGYAQVRAVRSVRRAVVLADLYRPALMFIDLELPADGALEVARHVVRVACQPAPRLVGLTAHLEYEEQISIAGFECRLVKPLSQSGLDHFLRTPTNHAASVIRPEDNFP